MSFQPGTPEGVGSSQPSQRTERVPTNHASYRTLMENTLKPYKDWSSKMHDIELFARPDSRQRPIIQKNLQDSLGQLLGGATILSSEISRTIRGAIQEGSATITIGSFFKKVAKDGHRSNLEVPLSWLATSSFEGYTLADTLARYVYGVKADPADTAMQREPQQQDIPQRLEKLLDTQIPTDVLRNAAQRLGKNPVGTTLSMLLQEVSKSYPPFMENVARDLSSQQPTEQQSANLMLKAFQEFIATYPKPILIKEPLWKRLHDRIKYNRLFGKPKQPDHVFTPKEMAKLLKGTKKISRKSDRFMGTVNNAPSQIDGLTIDAALQQARKTHPDGIIPAIAAAAKTNAELNNQPFEGRLPLSPDQQKYLKRVKKEDRGRAKYYLEQDNYLLYLYQKYVPETKPFFIKSEQAKAYVYRDPEIKNTIASNPERTNIEELVGRIRAVLPEADIAKTTQFPYYSRYYMVDPKTVQVLANHVLAQEVRAPDSQQPEETRILTPNELAYLRLQIQNGISEEELGEATRILLSEKIHEGNFQNRKATI